MAKDTQKAAKDTQPASSFDAAAAFVQDEPKIEPKSSKGEIKTRVTEQGEIIAFIDGPPTLGDRVIKLMLVPTQGGDGTVVRLVKAFPHSPWSEGVQEDWGLVIDEGEAERPIASICVNLIARRQEISLMPLDVPDMAEAVKKYTDLGWVVE